MKISQLNMNFWKPVVTTIRFEDKNRYLADVINNEKPALIGINEFASGQKYIDDLDNRLDEYTVIKPIGFDNNAHPRSLMNLIVIKKNINFRSVDLKCSLPNRLNVLDINLLGDDKPPVHLVNIYMVQTAILPKHMRFKRELAHDCLWIELNILLKSYSGEPVILMGDLQETSKGNNIERLVKEFGYKELIAGNYAPVETFEYQTIDHILFSETAMRLLNPNSYEVDTASLAISDHPMLSVSVA